MAPRRARSAKKVSPLSPPLPAPTEKTMAVACLECRERHHRCSRTVPCARCVLRGTPCIPLKPRPRKEKGDICTHHPHHPLPVSVSTTTEDDFWEEVLELLGD